MSELYVPVDGVGDSDLLSSYSSFGEGNAAGQNMQWRPRSAPKNTSRSQSPFLGFWNRRGHHHHDDVMMRRTKDVNADSTEKLYSADGTMFGIHTSHHDIALSARSTLGTPNSSKDVKDSTSGSENGGPPPLTREEFEALPLAIQRKKPRGQLEVIQPVPAYLSIRPTTLKDPRDPRCGTVAPHRQDRPHEAWKPNGS
ncbi:hypothetical protein VP1G_11178 [Cytospora mali]|uniref:Uncharacterized protein n=1 Tax=Cytospora mali TaxID=578113 RepID=A0A194V871_CYTMA|nr:hypothetical protein VP1G_11178 [Valsa mali var. pyri (nom. inval.)]